MKTIVDDIFHSVTKIKTYKLDKLLDEATGFFYKRIDTNQLFLVTNYHVVTDPSEPPDKIRLLLHKNLSEKIDNDWYDIPLISNNKPLWKTSSFFKDADIAIIKIDDNQFEQKFSISPWTVKQQVPFDLIFRPGEDILVMGYPLGFFDHVNNLPILKNAIIASPWMPFKGFEGEPCFVIDARLHKGMSGSPVITKPMQSYEDINGNLKPAQRYYLTGIYSSNYQNPDRYNAETGEIEIEGMEHKRKYTSWPDTNDQLGLGQVWYAGIITEIVMQLF